jgi:hypothetical protein
MDAERSDIIALIDREWVRFEVGATNPEDSAIIIADLWAALRKLDGVNLYNIAPLWASDEV